MNAHLPRAERAKARLETLFKARPEHWHQQLDEWLQLATAGEVRRHWRTVAPGRPMPGWAK